MSEYEIMYLLSETVNRIWTHVAFWFGVSFAYIGASHLVFREIGWLKIGGMTVLYAAFTWHIYGIMFANAMLQNGFISDLENLRNSKKLITNAAQVYLNIDAARTDIWTQRISLFGLAATAILYLPISKLHDIRSNMK